MSISLKCSGCGSALKVPDAFAGKKVKCPKCAGVIVVPAAAEEEDFAPVEVLPEERIREAPAAKGRKPSLPPDDEEEEEEREDPKRRTKKTGIREGRDRDRVRDDRDSHRERVTEGKKGGKRRYEDEDEEDERDEKRSKFKPCPRCGARGAKRVLWTAWGSFYGPAMFSHVRCPDCAYCYNGKSGRSNLVPAIIFVLLPLIGIGAIIGGIVYILFARGHL